MKSMYRYIAGALIVLLCSSFYFPRFDQRNHGPASLFLICENGKWGYIDGNGTQKIPPVYFSAQNFSGGLAAVRQGGLFGYINTKGDFALEAKYDYAEPFSHGKARVYIGGKPFYIDRRGKILFDHDFTFLGSFGAADYTSARNTSGEMCLIDETGKPLTGADFSEIGSFHEGLSVVIQYTASKSWLERRPGVIDSTGKTVVPFGAYAQIERYSEGLTIARELKEENGHAKQVCLDKNGKVVYTVPRTKWRPESYDAEYHEGLMVVKIYGTNPDSLKRWTSENIYTGVVNTRGEIMFGDSTWKDLSWFSHGRAFAKVGERQWMLVNEVGSYVSNEVFSHVWGCEWGMNEDVFLDGKALVLGKDGWKFIDVNGKELSRQRWMKFYDSEVKRDHDNVILGDEGVSLWIPGDTALAKKWFGGAVLSTLSDELIEVQFVGKDDELTWGYVNHKGEEVWRYGVAGASTHKTLNIDYMNRGYFMASSPRDRSLDGYGGWGGSDNGFAENHKLSIAYEKEKLQIIIDTAGHAEWFHGYAGYPLYVVNDAKQKYYFEAQDSRISMVMQAKDANGEWKDIEYLPNSWCGNSYHTLYLDAGTFWKFVTPVYEGSMQTKLRAKLFYKATSGYDKDEEIMYSNEVNGSVNPGQFWRKREYFPQGLMDPYVE